MAMISGRTSGLCLQRSSRASVLKAALPTRTFVRQAGPQRKAQFVPRAETDTQVDTSQVVADLQAKWDKVENKSQVAAYTAGAVLVAWLTSQLLGTINHLPLLPRAFEAVGLGYFSWFTYRYLLFKTSRAELLTDIEELKKKISGEVDA